jgi:hydrogenase maturation protease
MPDLRVQLDRCLGGRVCLVGLGNPDYGDDGLGLRLAETVAETLGRSGDFPGAPDVIIAGTTPEAFMGRMAEGGAGHVVFLDAVEFGAAPGSVILLNADEMAARFPQVSTHKISLGLLASFIEKSGTAKAWLLGVQPESLKPAKRLTPLVQETIEVLNDLLCDLLRGQPARTPANSRTDDQSQRWTYDFP